MLYWVIQITVISVIFILVVHNIFNFLKTTLTVPKAKDLVDVHMEKYKHIYATLKKGDESGSIMNQIPSSSGTTNIDDIPVVGDQTLGEASIGHLLSPSENMNMKKVPDLVFIIDTNYESLAIKESIKLGIPIIAILDTNSDPEGIDFPIPGNDDARRSIDLYCSLMKDTINDAKNYISTTNLEVQNSEKKTTNKNRTEKKSENKLN